MGIPGFESLAADIIQGFGQPAKIRLDMEADPVVERETTAFFRESTLPGVMFDRPQQPPGPFVQFDIGDDQLVGIVVERCEIDISVLAASDTGPIVIGGNRYTIAGWTTYTASAGNDDGKSDDGIFVKYRLHKKL